MKVLQVLPQLNFGGVEVGTVDLAKYLVKEGHQAYVMSAGGPLEEELKKLGVMHYKLPIHKKSLKTIGLIQKVEEIINRENIDIVHARSRIPALVCYFATRKTEAKFITTCHGYYSDHLLSRVMGWGQLVIVISNTIGRRMIDTFDVNPDRIRLVHRGLDISRYAFDEKRYQRKRKKSDKIIITNIARITPLKGHRDFLKAIRLVKRKVPLVEIWLVGAHSSKKKYYNELLELVEKLGLQDSVRFLGARRDIPEILQKSDMLVLSTTVPEGFGRVLVEAGAIGTPVISTGVGGVLDVIEDGEHGYLVPPSDPVSMSENILKVIAELPTYEPKALAFRERIEKNFTLQIMAKKTVAVYTEAIKNKRVLVHKYGALGDVILIVPSLRAIRKKYPKAYIAVLVDITFSSILESCPYVDEVITFRRKAKGQRWHRFWTLIQRIRKKRFDVSIDFQNNKWSHLISYCSGNT